MGTTPLTVYKASAGSGKTFTLAVRYISQLIANPDCYEEILAVTFTNKATEEMKTRIMGQLYGIWKGHDDSDDYLEAVIHNTGKTEEEVRRNAGIALKLLIHKYNYFRVQTIDSFFQNVLRNLARELELSANLRVDLNDRQVEEFAVDTIIDSLDTDKQMLSWIKEYITRNIEDDNSWNVIGSIKAFGLNIFKDHYKKYSQELERLMKDDNFFNKYTEILRKKKSHPTEMLKKEASRLYQLLRDNGYDDTSMYKFKDKGTIPVYVKKLAESYSYDDSPTPTRVQLFIDNPENMLSKDSVSKQTLSFFEGNFNKALERFEEMRHKAWFETQSATLTLRHINQLRLIHAIEDTVNSINTATNRFQLSNTQSLLHSIIEDSDAPFVFEKIGAHLKHIMIDEFQDTSLIQWANFKTLLMECLSKSESQSLIVGDVKQSIYRWRSGDWRLLNNIQEEFNKSQMQIIPLSTNYRSERRIVEFNNAFFSEAVNATFSELTLDEINGKEQLCNAYNSRELIQETKKQTHKGFIRISLLPSKDYDDAVMNNLLESVEQLLDKGIRQKDIAILVRTNRHIPKIAEMFMKNRPDINLVSDEAFRLDASMSVNMIIMALKVIQKPDDVLTKATLAKYYHQYVIKDTENEEKMFLSESVDTMLPEEFSNISELSSLPLIEMIDRIYSVFSLHAFGNQGAYICALYDIVNNFLEDNPADISLFLNEWENVYSEKTIQSDETDGIRIISIHKSKGLEFPHVIIPYCDWELEKDNIIWCDRKHTSPFDQLPVIPISFSKKQMLGTVYEDDYKEEHLQNVVDNLNLLYVAFTRAGKSLVVIGKRMSKDKINKRKSSDYTSTNRSQIIEEVLPKLIDKDPKEGLLLSGCHLLNSDDYDEPLTFVWGEIENESKQATESLQSQNRNLNVFTPTEIPQTIEVKTFPPKASFKQSNKSKAFVTSSENTPQSQQSYIKLGNILHQLFSTISTFSDFEPHLRQMQIDGILSNDEVNTNQIKEKINQAITHPLVKDWFSGKWVLFNECNIIERNPQTNEITEHRPDRVMVSGDETIVVDFKFGVPRNEYHSQVQRYMQLLHNMGYKGIRGYLWYVVENKVVEVDM